MKTNVELPETLVRELQCRADHKGQDLAEAVTELLWMGLATWPIDADLAQRPTIKSHAITGLPYIECSRWASPETEITPERMADVLIQQDAAWHHEASR